MKILSTGDSYVLKQLYYNGHFNFPNKHQLRKFQELGFIKNVVIDSLQINVTYNKTLKGLWYLFRLNK